MERLRRAGLARPTVRRRLGRRIVTVVALYAVAAAAVGLIATSGASLWLSAVSSAVTVISLPFAILAWLVPIGSSEQSDAPALPGRNPRRVSTPMAPIPAQPVIDRPALRAAVLAALTAEPAGPIVAPVMLVGTGGFGKTTLAAEICRRREAGEFFPGGVLWVSIGEHVSGPAITERVNDLCEAVAGRRPMFSDPERAGLKLAELLAGRPRTLIVVDDVWGSSQLRLLLFGLSAQVRMLVTTRDRSLAPLTATRIVVDAMEPAEARDMLEAGLPEPVKDEVANCFADGTGRWPVLLSLVHGAIRRAINTGLSVQDAAEHVLSQLESQGPLAFDMRRAEDRHDAVRATMEASLNLLEPNELERYLDLAVFPEDVDIPVRLLYEWWTSVHGIGSEASERLIEDFQRLSLLEMLRRANGATALRLHDVIRDYIRRRCGEAELRKRNQLLLDSAKLLPHGGGAGQLSDWWYLPREQEYLWRTLSFHLIEAGCVRELRTLVCDLRWIVAKIDVTGGAAEVELDLILADSPESGRLARALARCSHVLSPVTPATVDTLLAYLAADPAPSVRASAKSFLATYSAPLLTPVWPLPEMSSPGIRRVIDDHRTWLRSCAAAPDGRWIATAGDDHTVRLFALDTGEAGPVLSGHLAPIRGCAFFPGGRRMASASDDSTVRIWDRSSGEQLCVLDGHSGRVRGCAVAPDGTWVVSAGDDGTLRIWDVASAGTKAVLRGHEGPVRSCAVAPRGDWIVSTGDDSTVRLWEVAGGSARLTLTGHNDWVNACAVAPDGSWIATTSDDLTLRIWDAATGVVRAAADDFPDWVYCCAASPDGRWVASGCADGELRVHDAASGTRVAGLKAHATGIRGVVFTPDRRSLVTVGDDAMIRVWAVDELPTAQRSSDRPANSCSVTSDGRGIVTGGDDGTVWLRSTEGDAKPTLLAQHADWVRSCACAVHAIASCGDDGVIMIHDMRSVLASRTRVAGVYLLSCALSPDGSVVAAAGNDGTVRLWNIASTQQAAVLSGHIGWVNACAFSPDGSMLASAGEDHVLRVWDAGNWENLASLRVDAALRDCAWVPGMAAPAVCVVGVGGSYLFGLSQDASLRTSQ